MPNDLKILEALAQLDPADDAHWTPDGLPRVGIIQKLANDQTITRRDVLNVAPLFNREPARISANPHRALAILDATKQIIARSGRPTAAEVTMICAKLGDFGEADQSEVDAALALIIHQADQHAAKLEAEAAPAVDDASAPIAPAAEVEKAEEPSQYAGVPPAELHERLRLARIALADTRANIQRLTTIRQRCRAELAAAIEAWTRGLPRITKEQALREVIETTRANRDSQMQRVNPGPSVIDRVAANQRGGPAAWGNFRRGASTVRGGLNFDPRKGPVAKLPSQQ